MTTADRNRGAVWVLFLNNDGTVKSHQKISDTEGGFTGSHQKISDTDGVWVLFLTARSSRIRRSFDTEGGFTGIDYVRLVLAGDLDGDGVGDLAVGAPHDGMTTGAFGLATWCGVGAAPQHRRNGQVPTRRSDRRRLHRPTLDEEDNFGTVGGLAG